MKDLKHPGFVKEIWSPKAGLLVASIILVAVPLLERSWESAAASWRDMGTLAGLSIHAARLYAPSYYEPAVPFTRIPGTLQVYDDTATNGSTRLWIIGGGPGDQQVGEERAIFFAWAKCYHCGETLKPSATHRAPAGAPFWWITEPAERLLRR